MSRGSIQLRHRKGKRRCAATGKDSRRCTCGPTVYAVLAGDWVKLDHLPEGWRKDDLQPFEEELADMRRRLSAGEPYRPVEPKLLWEWAQQWFDYLHDLAETGDISRLTYEKYKGSYVNHLEPAFGDTPLAAITPDMVRRFIRSKMVGQVDEDGEDVPGLSPRTANALITPLSAMLTDARAEGLIPSNPCQQPRRGRHGASGRGSLLAEVKAEKPKHLEPAEACALLAAVPEEHRDMVLAALSTGFRRGELIGLRWEDISWAEGRIELRRQLQRRKEVKPKYSSYREVPLYSGLRAALSKRRQAEGYVFLDSEGRPWADADTDRAFLRDAYEQARLSRPGVLWHALRHTYASICAHGGIREDVVAVLMGHKRRGTTSIYTHLFEDAFEGVEEALDAVLGVKEMSTEGVSPSDTGSSPVRIDSRSYAGASSV
ncbi:MAG: tyrosine-type recombinase/integrase [Solirubrobacterales bacterium]